jgi:hypothetical protein
VKLLVAASRPSMVYIKEECVIVDRKDRRKIYSYLFIKVILLNSGKVHEERAEVCLRHGFSVKTLGSFSHVASR